MTSTLSNTAIRASEAARCYRMAALRALGHEPAPLHPEAEEYLHRGRYFEELVVRRLVAKYGADDVERQVEIDWGFGEPGHADAYIRSEKAIVEIKSTSLPSFSVPMFDMALAQTELYVRFHPEAEVGWLMLLDPNRMRPEEVVTVKLTDEKIAAIDAACDTLREALAGSGLPERVCSKPSQARSRMCAFAEACFAGWEPPPPSEIPDPEVLARVASLADIREQMRPLRGELAVLEEAATQAKAELAALLDEGENLIGPYMVVKKHVVKQPTFQAKLAKAAGFPLDALAEFMRPGAEYDTITIKRAADGGEIDYGEVPF